MIAPDRLSVRGDRDHWGPHVAWSAWSGTNSAKQHVGQVPAEPETASAPARVLRPAGRVY